MAATSLDLTFWGVRGSIPTPSPENLAFGGNTACLAIRTGGDPPIIFDAGTGIRALGNELGEAKALHIFLTHFHWDHIQGLPSFKPLFNSHCATTIHSTADPAELERILAAQMRRPYFPVPMPAHVAYRKVEHEGTRIGDLLIRPFPLHHPGGATGYRIESSNATIVYATDHEHGDPESDALLLQNADHADVLIYDAQYTPAEYEHQRGWGHSTWREAVQFAQRARVKRLILFHHDPNRTDEQLARIVSEAQSEFANTTAATEGSTLQL
ncbi:MAG: MBL fold metallo-hydrolase [Bryobacteraceae bacterium]